MYNLHYVIIHVIYISCKDKKKTKDNGQQTIVFFEL